MQEINNHKPMSQNADNSFHNVSLLITHYNRSQSLKRLLEAFRDVSFAAIIVSDDCSKDEHLSILKELSVGDTPFTLLAAEKNSGLGNNINKGQDAVRTPYTLYVQEDFVPTDKFLSKFRIALAMMEADHKTDFIRFYGYRRYPYLKPADANGFSEMYLPFFATNYKKIYQYSDHPISGEATSYLNSGGIKKDSV